MLETFSTNYLVFSKIIFEIFNLTKDLTAEKYISQARLLCKNLVFFWYLKLYQNFANKTFHLI